AGLIEFRRETIELLPECIGDLKIVPLVPNNIDEGEIASIAEVTFRRPHADGFAALPMQVAPVAAQGCVGRDTQRVGARNLLAMSEYPQVNIAGRVYDEILQHTWAIAGLDRNAFRQAAHRARWHQREIAMSLRRGVSPH